MIKCSNCGKELPEGSKFCPFCRSATRAETPPAAAGRLCPVCGAPVDPAARFCTNCRSPLTTEENAPSVAGVLVCPKCGQRCEKGSAFCVSCGFRFNAGEQSAEGGSKPSVPPRGPSGEIFGKSPEIEPVSTAFMPPRRVPMLRTPVIWVVAAVVVLAVVLILLLRPSTSSAPASASAMMDDFTQDQSFSAGLWVVNGPVATVVSSRLSSEQTSLISPAPSFSAESGLEITGGVRPGETAAVQSVSSFGLPLSVKADVMPSPSGDSFGLVLSNTTGAKGIAIGGRLTSAERPGTIEYSAPGLASKWNSLGTLLNSPQANAWYTLRISLDAHGNGLLKVRSGGKTVGQTAVQVGQGRFYVVLLQTGSGQPASSLGHTHWRSIEVLSGAGLIQAARNPVPKTTPGTQVSGLGLPTVENAMIQSGQTSLTLPPGSSIYLYGMATGGAAPSSPFSNGPYAQASDAAGQLAVALAASPENTNVFTTQTGYQTLGAVAVSGFRHYGASYGSNGSSGASSASDTFTVSRPSLVVVIGLASSQQNVNLAGIAGIKIDASGSAQGASDGVIIAHAYLGPGRYTVTEQSAATAGGQDPNHMADLVGVFVFQ